MSVWFNLFCQNIQAQMEFYQAVLGWPEALASRSPIYRGLEQAGIQLGFNAPEAYELLNLDDRAPRIERPAIAYASFILDQPEAVDAAVERAREHGASVVKGPYPTYYGQVLCDPEGNVFRIAAARLPPGVKATPPPA